MKKYIFLSMCLIHSISFPAQEKTYEAIMKTIGGLDDSIAKLEIGNAQNPFTKAPIKIFKELRTIASNADLSVPQGDAWRLKFENQMQQLPALCGRAEKLQAQLSQKIPHLEAYRKIIGNSHHEYAKKLVSKWRYTDIYKGLKNLTFGLINLGVGAAFIAYVYKLPARFIMERIIAAIPTMAGLYYTTKSGKYFFRGASFYGWKREDLWAVVHECIDNLNTCNSNLSKILQKQHQK